MSVLIKGMDFPTKENFMTQLYLICDEDGYWYAVDTTNKDLYKLIEVKEPHGRLIDADALKSKFRHGEGDSDADSAWISTIRRFITQADTIIEAEGEK